MSRQVSRDDTMDEHDGEASSAGAGVSLFPPAKRSRRQVVEVPGCLERLEEGQPLRCSTPQPPGEEPSGQDLDTSLEDLGISRDSIGS